MTDTAIADERRQKLAASTLEALGIDRADHQVLLVECQRGHTLAAVYTTDVGPVFVSHPRPNLLDERDLIGDQHHRRGRPDHEFVDLLASTWPDDDLPAGCYCGNHVLSRSDIENDLDAGRRLVVASRPRAHRC